MVIEKEIELTFFTTGQNENIFRHTFGSTTLGFCCNDRWIDSNTPDYYRFPYKIEGIIINDSLEGAYLQLDKLLKDEVYKRVKGAVILFGNCGNENTFMKYIRKKFQVPFIGGSSAIGEDGVAGRILPNNNQVSILLITDDRYAFEWESKNIHNNVLEQAIVLGNHPRYIENFKIQDNVIRAYDYIQEIAAQKKVESGLCERIAISDSHGRNIHLIPDGLNFKCGADLPEDRKILIRYTSVDNAYMEMSDFFSSDNSLIFGCAGLKSIIAGRGLSTGKNSVGLFMFGEVTGINGYPDFGNLMLTKIRVLPNKSVT